MSRNGLQENVFTLITAVSDCVHSSAKGVLSFVNIKVGFVSIDHEFLLENQSNLATQRCLQASLIICITFSFTNLKLVMQ